MLGRTGASCALLLALLGGCGSPPEPTPDPPIEAEDRVRGPSPETVIPEVPRELDGEPRGLRPANLLDEAYAGTGTTRVRRLVYRARMRTPYGLGPGAPAIPPPTGELQLDVAAERLRARFAGPGWPVVPGSEVRVRRDAPGGYIFDGDGGRPIAPGGLAVWFQGGPPPRDATVHVRQSQPDDIAVASLVCRFFAEWANASADRLVRSCGSDLPLVLVLGPYHISLTGDVDATLPARALRADHEAPPPPVAAARSRTFATASQLAQLQPHHDPPTTVPARPAEATIPDEGLRVWNRSPVRLVVTVDGNAIGWLDAGETVTFPGIPPGHYWVGGMRPLGGIGAAPRVLTLPAYTRMPVRDVRPSQP